MADLEKLAAVRKYLETEFPGSAMDDWFESGRQAHSFRISGEGFQHLATVSLEFLDDTDSLEIASRLKGFLLAEHLRDLGSTRVIVTSDGLSLEA